MRARQSGDYCEGQTLTAKMVQLLLMERLEKLDLDAMKADVRPFLRNPKGIDSWNKEFFLGAFKKLQNI